MGLDPAIAVRGLEKHYGDLTAVASVDFTVARGEVYGLLGPNGAGKTTTVEILEGYRERSGGEVSVLGRDPAERDRSLQDRKSTRLNSSHANISYAVFCLIKKSPI